MVVAHRTPYVDLSIWGPYGRKVHKRNKFWNWIPDGEGGCLSQEIPGPENYQVWLIGWRVFATACVMLRIGSTSALEAYETRMEKLVRLWGDAWLLISTTDDHMRAEQIERPRRTLPPRHRHRHKADLVGAASS